MSNLIAPDLRRKACALALPAFPLALLVGTLITPTDSTDNAVQLRAAAAHSGRWQAAALVELLAAALLPLAVAGVVGAVRQRGARLATVAAVFGVLGTLGMASISFRHLFIYGLANADQASALHVLDRMDNHVGAIALPLIFAAPLGLLLLSAAAARASLAPSWVTIGAFAFFISDMLPIPAAEEIQGLVGLATFGMIALHMLRLDAEPANAPAVTTARLQPSAAKARA